MVRGRSPSRRSRRSCSRSYDESSGSYSRSRSRTLSNPQPWLTASLVQQVKSIQRESATGRDLWNRLTDEEGGKVRDPARHKHDFLKRFLDQAGRQGLSGLSGMGTGNSSRGPLQDLVEEVKNLQRRAPDVKSAWGKFCDEKGRGVRDPSRHTKEFLEEFLSRSGSKQGEEEWVPKLGEAELLERPSELLERVREVERRSEDGKQLWHWWCELEGGSTRCPDRNSPALMTSFLIMMQDKGTVAKFRRRNAPNPNMIDKLNSLQRNDREITQTWEQYCDEHGNGTRDPRLHTSDFLERFLRARSRSPRPRQTPRLPVSLHPHPRPSRASSAPPQGGSTVKLVSSAENSNSELHALIERVKDCQRDSYPVRRLWHWFCETEGGDIRDPIKHDARFLQRFLDLQAQNLDLPCTRMPPEELLTKVADAKRGREGGHKWERYCDEHGGGTYDMRMHATSFLRGFLDMMGLPTDEQNGPDLVEEVLQVQKRSPEAWERFCDEHGDGERDARRQSASFLQRFLDAAEEDTQKASVREELQKQVQDLVEGSQEFRRHWQTFCDREGGGDLNPDNHGSVFLRDFLDRVDRGPSADRDRNSPVEAYRDSTVDVAAGTIDGGKEQNNEATKKELAEEVRSKQKSSRRVNEAWSVFCNAEGGGTRDPNRHDCSFLRMFLRSLDQSQPTTKATKALPAIVDDDPLGLMWVEKPRTEDSSWDELVRQVQSAKRASSRTNEQWNDYCDERGLGTRDPRSHNTAFLRDFLSRVETPRAESPAPRAPSPRVEAAPAKRGHLEERASWQEKQAGWHEKPPEMKGHEWAEQQRRKGEEDKTDLCSKVQDLLAASRQTQDAWNQLCDSKGCGVRDPTRHVASFLQRFLSSVEKDAQGGASSVQAQLKESPRGAQLKESPRGRGGTWTKGGTWVQEGSWVPPRSQDGWTAPSSRGQSSTARAGGEERQPREVPRSEAPKNRRQEDADDLCEDPEKEELVNKVKGIQSSSMRINEKWSEYCNSLGGGTRDPSRHPAHFLRSFLATLPAEWRKESRKDSRDDEGRGQKDSWSGESRGRKRPWESEQKGVWREEVRGGSWKEPAPSSRRVRPRRDEARDEDDSKEKRDLVEQVKQWQRTSRSNTEAWKDHCEREGGGVCDPSRHPASFLSEFLRGRA